MAHMGCCHIWVSLWHPKVGCRVNGSSLQGFPQGPCYCRPMIYNSPSFRGLNSKILIRIPMQGRGFINEGSTLLGFKVQGILHVMGYGPADLET